MTEKINIRPAVVPDAVQIAEVHINTWRSAYSGIIDPEFLNSLSLDKFKKSREETIKNEKLHNIVAETENRKIVGFAVCGYERTHDKKYSGEISAIYVLHEYQNMGIGIKLFRQCINSLIRDNFNSMKIWVLKENKYQKFYKKLGGIVLEEKEILFGDKIYTEIAFGWNDLIELKTNL
jgi:ribosomal protein S18 acetylase RimI-like enzyme